MLCAFYLLGLHSHAQVNSINISSSQQLVNPASTFNAWKVTGMSPAMQGAVCIGNTNGWDCLSSTTQIPPVALNTPAQIVSYRDLANWTWPTGDGIFSTYLSCYPVNTIFTPLVSQNTFDNITMTVSRDFFICGQGNARIILDFKISADNSVLSVVLDAGSANAQSLLAAPVPDAITNPVSIQTASLSLAPGLHTISVTTSNYQQPASTAHSCYVGGQLLQMNPMGVSIAGAVTAEGNVLYNSNIAGSLSLCSISGPKEVCALESITLRSSTPNGTWTSSDPSVATVSPTGVVTGVKPGSSIITYTVGSGPCARTASYPVTVTNCHCEDPCSWSKTGNTNINDWNFLGSINAAPVKISTNNTTRIIVPANGIQTVTNANAYSNLLIGPDGTLYKTDCRRDPNGRAASGRMVAETEEEAGGDTQQQIRELKEEVEQLKQLVNTLMKAGNYSPLTNSGRNSLSIVPTPFSNNAVAVFDIQEAGFKGGTLQVVDINGRLIKSLAINQAKGQVAIGDISTAASAVIFNIVSDGRIIISKKSIKQ